MVDLANALTKSVLGALEPILHPVSIYAAVPHEAKMPYVVLDTLQINDNGNVTRAVDEAFLYLSVWTQYSGPKQANAIVGQVNETLHRTRLPLESGKMIAMSVIRRGSEPDIAEEIYKGFLTVRCLLQPE